MRGERATLGKSLLDVQRELKIKATYIAAIENADVSAFETPGFVAGYVRSYARYLGMDPDGPSRSSARGEFHRAHGMSAGRIPPGSPAKRAAAAEFRDPLANPNATFVPRGESWLMRGWNPARWVGSGAGRADRRPSAMAAGPCCRKCSACSWPRWIRPRGGGRDRPAGQRRRHRTGRCAARPRRPRQVVARPWTPRPMDRLAYRPQALDVPVLVRAMAPSRRSTRAAEPAGAGVELAPAVPARMRQPAVCRCWPMRARRGNAGRAPVLGAGAGGGWHGAVRKDPGCGRTLCRAADGNAAHLRAGNSGSVYFAVNGKTYGPAAPGAQVVQATWSCRPRRCRKASPRPI
jgi:hypothetical protein